MEIGRLRRDSHVVIASIEESNAAFELRQGFVRAIRPAHPYKLFDLIDLINYI